jgi:histone H1/5
LTAAKKKAAAEAQKPKPKPAPKPVAKPAPKPAPKPKTAPKPVATYTPDGTEQTAKPKLTSTVKKAPSKASLRARKVLARKKKAAAKRLAAAAKRTANKAAQRARRDLRKKKKSPKYNSDGTVPKSVTQTAEGRNTPQGRRLARLEKRRERRTGVKRLYKK